MSSSEANPKLITQIPTFITKKDYEEIQRTTPNDFTQIPPVLHHKQENCSALLTLPLEDWPTSSQQIGDLYVTEEALSFFSTSLNKGFSIPYPYIALHAVSRTSNQQEEQNNKPCIYCHLESPQEQGEAETESDPNELTLVPQTEDAVETIFGAISHCSSLHPSQLDEDEDEDNHFEQEDNGRFDSAEDPEELSEVGRATRDYLDSIIDWGNHRPPQQDDQNQSNGQ